MTFERLTRSRVYRALALLPGVALLLVLYAGGVHHHDQDAGSRPCAICSLSHAPVTVAVVTIGHAPVVHSERVHVVPQGLPRTLELHSPDTRGPPAA